MNENLNLVEILKDCPSGTKLYSTIFGEVEFVGINSKAIYYPIVIRLENLTVREYFTIEGKLFAEYNGECVLFPSKEQRDWNKFNTPWRKKENKHIESNVNIKKKRFDPKTLQSFDKVLAREDEEGAIWFADFISQPYNESTKSIFVIGSDDNCIVIPYNNETKHLIGTEDNAPKYYRYWED